MTQNDKSESGLRLILLRTIWMVMLGTWAFATLGGEWYYRR